MYYVIADLEDKSLHFTDDTSYKRRLTPSAFYAKDNHPVVVVNACFFSFATSQNLNTVVKNGELIGYNIHSVPARGKDTLTYYHSFDGAFGISKNREADVAWLYTDSSKKYPYASETVIASVHDSVAKPSFNNLHKNNTFKIWKMQTAVGGGPVLIQNNKVQVSNNEERKFFGKAINDRHPRTAIGYTNNNQVIILVAEGRSETASGLALTQEAQILKDLGCKEALNLDGGGSSCMIINGKQTNSPSDKEGERPVPSVFMIERK